MSISRPPFYEDLPPKPPEVQVVGSHMTFLPSWPDGGSGGWQNLSKSDKLGPMIELHAPLMLSVSPSVSTQWPAM